MKIYTKTGDKGTTELIGGKRVPKYHGRIEAYGSVDELMSYIGLLRDQKSVANEEKIILIEIQDRLMTCASILAADCEDCKESLPKLLDEDIIFLENEIDKIDEVLPPLKSFILPGGHSVVSYCHIARNVCRRAERISLKVSEVGDIDGKVLKYLNRLSDYLFMLARKLSHDLNVEEIPWKPRL